MSGRMVEVRGGANFGAPRDKISGGRLILCLGVLPNWAPPGDCMEFAAGEGILGTRLGGADGTGERSQACKQGTPDCQ